MPQEFDISGIFADEKPLVLHDGLRDRGLFAGDRPFAESNQPLVGVDLAVDPVDRPRIHHERFESGDLQVECLGSGADAVERGQPEGPGEGRRQ